LALAVIFEEVVLPPADAPMPGRSDGFPNTLDFALPSFDVVRQAVDLLEHVGGDCLADQAIRRALAGVPERARPLVLEYALIDVLLSAEYSAPVLSGPGRRTIIERLIQLGVVPGSTSVAALLNQGGGVAEAVEAYSSIVGLRFAPDKADTLGDIKGDASIRRYAAGFQDALIAPGPDKTSQLLARIADAWESRAVADTLSGAFAATSRVVNPFGLVPGVGTVTTAIGIASDASQALAARRAATLRWYEFGPEINRFRSLRALEQALDVITAR
jgi:hypothetical protein